MQPHELLRVESIDIQESSALVSYTWWQNDSELQDSLVVSRETGLGLEAFLAKRPFKDQPAPPYTYWIGGVTCHLEQLAASACVRSDPRLVVYIKRGKSRVLDNVDCTPEDWEQFKPVCLRAWTKGRRDLHTSLEAGNTYTWARASSGGA